VDTVPALDTFEGIIEHIQINRHMIIISWEIKTMGTFAVAFHAQQYTQTSQIF
jgi:hypothetical protein